MTGAGKTHTMIGSSDVQQDDDFQLLPEQGLCFQAVEGLFEQIDTLSAKNNYTVKVSYLEIYNEQVRDLLSDIQTQLMIVEDPIRGIVVPDLGEQPIQNAGQLHEIIQQGNRRRMMAATGANQFSSRSHAILAIQVESRKKTRDIREEIIYSKLQIIDLAGSERAASTENRGQRMIEGANINRSLLALGNCINTLSDRQKAGSFVPYRDSKLTRLLKDSLGGNTKTIMIACISPSFLAYEETINTLKYASRARNIKRKAVRNVREIENTTIQYKEIIESLQQEVSTLKNYIASTTSGTHHQSNHQRRQTYDNLSPSGPPLLSNHTKLPKSKYLLPKTPADISHKQYDSANSPLPRKLFQEDTNLKSLMHQKQALLSEQSLNGYEQLEEESKSYEVLLQSMVTSIEEVFDLKKSISELEELQEKNKEMITSHRKEIFEYQRKNPTIMLAADYGFGEKAQEIAILEESYQQNQIVLIEMANSLQHFEQQRDYLRTLIVQKGLEKYQRAINIEQELKEEKIKHIDSLIDNGINEQKLLDKLKIKDDQIMQLQQQLNNKTRIGNTPDANNLRFNSARASQDRGQPKKQTIDDEQIQDGPSHAKKTVSQPGHMKKLSINKNEGITLLQQNYRKPTIFSPVLQKTQSEITYAQIHQQAANMIGLKPPQQQKPQTSKTVRNARYLDSKGSQQKNDKLNRYLSCNNREKTPNIGKSNQVLEREVEDEIKAQVISPKNMMQLRASGQKQMANTGLQQIPEFSKFDLRKFSDEPIQVVTQKQNFIIPERKDNTVANSRDASPNTVLPHNNPYQQNLSQSSSVRGLQSYQQIRQKSKERQNQVVHRQRIQQQQLDPVYNLTYDNNGGDKMESLSPPDTSSIEQHLCLTHDQLNKQNFEELERNSKRENPSNQAYSQILKGAEFMSFGQSYFDNYLKKKNFTKESGGVEYHEIISKRQTIQSSIQSNTSLMASMDFRHNPMLSTTQVLLSQKNDQTSSHQASMTKSREASLSPSKNEPFLHNNTQLKPDLGTLLQRQKAQLQAEKEKLEKKKYAFESSFGHTLATVSVATNNPDQQVVLQTERSHKESQRGGNNSNMSGLRKYIQAQCPQINSRYANNNNSSDSLPSHQSAEEQQSDGMVNSKEQQRAGQKHETSVQIGGMMISNQ